MMRMLPLLVLALTATSPAAAVVTISFSGSGSGHSVSGTLRYDETAAPAAINPGTGFTVGQYFPNLATGYAFAVVSDSVTATTGYRASVFDAQPGSGMADSFGAFVVAGASGVQQYSFSIDYPTATALTGIGLPTLLPQGPATFAYSFAGQGYSIPVTWSAQAGAIPEPASWALLIAGFGLAGGALRRRAKVGRPLTA